MADRRQAVPAANDNAENAASLETRRASGKPCPICSKPSEIGFRPFCSARCADIDLHRWLGGTYAIPAAAKPDDGAEDDED